MSIEKKHVGRGRNQGVMGRPFLATPSARNIRADGRTSITAWVDPAFKAQMAELRTRFPDYTVGEMVADALNLLFRDCAFPLRSF